MTPPRLLALAVLAGLLATGAQAAIEEHLAIEGPFADGPAVTALCLDCHEDAAHEFMQTTHWTWSAPQEIPGRGVVDRGKKNAINNFCISIAGNEPRCTSCHAGYGWADASFDFQDPTRVDCLVCHDRTDTYRKFPTGAGHPAYKDTELGGAVYPAVDLLHVARNVGAPTRRACGSCHFFGGGGNAIKHGDLDKSLIAPTRAVDIHMAPEGEDMSCQDCHATESHRIGGNALVVSPGGGAHIDCTDCHDDNPHTKKAKLIGKHLDRVACQTCHIPLIAKAAPTKVWWDWSDAGKDLPVLEDGYGKPTFAKKKGSFTWAKDFAPDYAWYNGTAGAYLAGDRMRPGKITRLNWPEGSRDDPYAKIYPFKVMRGRQPYDVQNEIFVTPKLFGKTGFWKTFDWRSAAEQGMAQAGLDFSGELDFAETVMYWKINHMVAPKEQALTCRDCHSKTGEGRMDWMALGYDGDPKIKQRATD